MQAELRDIERAVAGRHPRPGAASGGDLLPSSRMSSSFCCRRRAWFPRGANRLARYAMAILVIVLLNALMGYVQQARAEQERVLLRARRAEN